MINTKLISTYFEGIKLVAYVPSPDGGAIESGATVANGFDLGQWSLDQLDDLPALLAFKLKPYCGITGIAAQEFLAKNPLSITQEECDILCEFSHKTTEKALIAMWEKDTEQDFYSLPDEMQTVIASVAYQYGSNLKKRCPMFWNQAIRNDWAAMARNLWKFGDAFTERRHAERAILLLGITKR